MSRFSDSCIRVCMFFFLMALLVLSYSCSSDEENLLGSVRGRIFSTLNDEPLQGANVTLSPGGYSTVVGSDGFFEFLELDPGQYSLQAQKADYRTNYKQITVVAGQVASGDLGLIPIQTTSSIEVSPTVLDFGTSLVELTFDIRNNGDVGTVEWSVSGIDVNWLQVSPMKGTTGQLMTSKVKVRVDRVYLDQPSTTYITIDVPGGSATVRVTASPSI